jgi:hypothetical protein
LARQLVARSFDAKVALAWITGTSVNGEDRSLRGWLEQRNQAYVLAVSSNEAVWVEQQHQQIKTVLMETDCGLRNLPSHVPPWQTV